jgi:hypothetical protein
VLQALLLTVLPPDLHLVRGDGDTEVTGEGGGGVTEVERRREADQGNPSIVVVAREERAGSACVVPSLMVGTRSIAGRGEGAPARHGASLRRPCSALARMGEGATGCMHLDPAPHP